MIFHLIFLSITLKILNEICRNNSLSYISRFNAINFIISISFCTIWYLLFIIVFCCFYVLLNFLCIGVGIIPHNTNHIPTPMILLDSTQYNKNYNETIVTQNMQHQYLRSQSHPTSSNTIIAQETIYHPCFQRPYSFTDGQVNDLVEIQGEPIFDKKQMFKIYHHDAKLDLITV